MIHKTQKDHCCSDCKLIIKEIIAFVWTSNNQIQFHYKSIQLFFGHPGICSVTKMGNHFTVRKTIQGIKNFGVCPQSIQWLYASSQRKVLCFRFRQRRSSSAQTLLTAGAPIPYNLPSFRRAAEIRELQHTLHVLSRIKLFIVESLKEIVRTKVNTCGSRSSVDSSRTAFKSWAHAGSLTIINNWLFADQLDSSQPQRRCPYLFLQL